MEQKNRNHLSGHNFYKSLNKINISSEQGKRKSGTSERIKK